VRVEFNPICENLSERMTYYVNWCWFNDEFNEAWTPEAKDKRWGPIVATADPSNPTENKGNPYEIRRKGKNQYSCQCKGWIFAGHCKHCDAAADLKGEVQDPYDKDFSQDASVPNAGKPVHLGHVQGKASPKKSAAAPKPATKPADKPAKTPRQKPAPAPRPGKAPAASADDDEYQVPKRAGQYESFTETRKFLMRIDG